MSKHIEVVIVTPEQYFKIKELKQPATPKDYEKILTKRQFTTLVAASFHEIEVKVICNITGLDYEK